MTYPVILRGALPHVAVTHVMHTKDLFPLRLRCAAIVRDSEG